MILENVSRDLNQGVGWGLGEVLLANDSESTGYLPEKQGFRFSNYTLHTHTQKMFKMIIDLNIRVKSIKPLEQKIKVNIFDPSQSHLEKKKTHQRQKSYFIYI